MKMTPLWSSLLLQTWLIGFLLAMPALSEDSPEALLQLGIAQMRLKRFEEARKPLEAAFDSAWDGRQKMAAAEAQMRVYRETSDFEKYLGAADWVIAHAERKAGRAVNRSQVSAFIHFNGKTDEAIKRYEKLLKKDKDDLAALNVLAEIYSRSDRGNPSRAKELIEHRDRLDKEIATSHALRLEKEAAADG